MICTKLSNQILGYINDITGPDRTFTRKSRFPKLKKGRKKSINVDKVKNVYCVFTILKNFLPDG